jgi:hypothetical protein
VGGAAATGVSAAFGTSLPCTVGNATSSGIQALIAGSNIIVCGVGNAIASGVQASISLAAPPSLNQADIDAIAAAVWGHSAAAQMATRLAEAWARLGLDASKPVTQDQTQISFGAVLMALTEAGGAVTVTRQ